MGKISYYSQEAFDNLKNPILDNEETLYIFFQYIDNEYKNLKIFNKLEEAMDFRDKHFKYGHIFSPGEDEQHFSCSPRRRYFLPNYRTCCCIVDFLEAVGKVGKSRFYFSYLSRVPSR